MTAHDGLAYCPGCKRPLVGTVTGGLGCPVLSTPQCVRDTMAREAEKAPLYVYTFRLWADERKAYSRAVYVLFNSPSLKRGDILLTEGAFGRWRAELAEFGLILKDIRRTLFAALREEDVA